MSENGPLQQLRVMGLQDFHRHFQHTYIVFNVVYNVLNVYKRIVGGVDVTYINERYKTHVVC